MEEIKNTIQLPEGYKGDPITLIVREGQAEVIKSRSYLSKMVTVLSIGAWISGRTFATPITENPGVIVYSLNPKKPTLQFIENPADSEGVVLSSQLKVNPDLEDFCINTDRFFSQKELEKLVRKNAHCFDKLDSAKALISALQNFQVKYVQTVERADDRQGQTKNLVETSIEQNKGIIPTKWQLKLPLFVAGKAVDVEIEVEIEKLPNNLPGFGFYSMELPVLLRQVAEDTIMGEVNKFSDNFVCLEVE